jgi:hypothetical protein
MSKATTASCPFTAAHDNAVRPGPSGLTLFPLGNRSLQPANGSPEYESEVRFIYVSRQPIKHPAPGDSAYDHPPIALPLSEL